MKMPLSYLHYAQSGRRCHLSKKAKTENKAGRPGEWGSKTFQQIAMSPAEDNTGAGIDLPQSSAQIRDIGPDNADLSAAVASPDLVHQLFRG